MIHESSNNERGHHSSSLETSTFESTSDGNGCKSISDANGCYSEMEYEAVTSQGVSTRHKEVQEMSSMNNCLNKELVLHGQNNQLVCSSNASGSTTNPSMLSTMERSLSEQIRANDLKSIELGITIKKLKLKETQLALGHDQNNLQRSKLAMGISKASFQAEKFKTQLEDTRHSELLRKCIDCLVAGIVTMSVSLIYAAYIYSYKKITDATAACTPSQVSSVLFCFVSQSLYCLRRTHLKHI